MKNSILFIAFILTLFGCQNVVQPQKPENLISQDKMVEILTETYMDNAARSIDYKTITSNGVKMDSLIYRKFNIDSLQFAQSNAYYAADINNYMQIMQNVEKKLTAMQQKMDSIWEKERLQENNAQKNGETESPKEPLKDSLI